MATVHAAEHTFHDAVTFESTISSAGALTIDSGGLTVTAGGITVTAGGETITAGNLVVTAGNITATAGTITAGAALVATTTATAAYFIQTTADVTTTDSAYALVAGVTGVNCVSTGAGGPYAITLGNNAVGHVCHIYASAINTGTFTVATAEGTTTLDATHESVTVRYNGTAWRVIGYHGTTGPV